MLEHFKAAPLSSSFMLAAILGFLISTLYVWKQSKAFGFAFAIIFAIMFVASLVSMRRAPVEAELALDQHASRSGSKSSKR